jgi:hypothetical protein
VLQEDDGHDVVTFLRSLKDIYTVDDLWLAYTTGSAPGLGLSSIRDSWRDMESKFKESGQRRGRGRKLWLGDSGITATYTKWRTGEGKDVMYNRKDIIQHVEEMILGGQAAHDAVAEVQAIVTARWDGSLYKYNTHLKGPRKKKQRKQ